MNVGRYNCASGRSRGLLTPEGIPVCRRHWNERLRRVQTGTSEAPAGKRPKSPKFMRHHYLRPDLPLTNELNSRPKFPLCANNGISCTRGANGSQRRY